MLPGVLIVAHPGSAHLNKTAFFLPLTGTDIILIFGVFRGGEGNEWKSSFFSWGFSFSILKFNHNQTAS